MKKLELLTNDLLIIAGAEERSLFSKINFPPERVVDFESCKSMLSGPEEKTPPHDMILDLFYSIIEKRLEMGLFTAANIPGVTHSIRQKLFEICNHYYYNPALAYFPEKRRLEDSPELFQTFKKEGFRKVHILKREDLFNFRIAIKPVTALCNAPPPYDIIGDIHGCFTELEDLFGKTGYEKQNSVFIHPEGRIPIFIGDITDRGPNSVKVMELVMDMVDSKRALFIPGNHCAKLARHIMGKDIKIKWGIETTLKEIESMDDSSRENLSNRFISLVENSPNYLMLDNGNLIVTHAAIKERMIGKEHRRLRSFCLYGSATGKNDENGLPIRRDWAVEYRGKPLVVYGHTPVEVPEFRFNTINIDQGCVFGGSLTALRYPEMKTESVKARKAYYCRMRNSVPFAGGV